MVHRNSNREGSSLEGIHTGDNDTRSVGLGGSSKSLDGLDIVVVAGAEELDVSSSLISSHRRVLSVAVLLVVDDLEGKDGIEVTLRVEVEVLQIDLLIRSIALSRTSLGPSHTTFLSESESKGGWRAKGTSGGWHSKFLSIKFIASLGTSLLQIFNELREWTRGQKLYLVALLHLLFRVILIGICVDQIVVGIIVRGEEEGILPRVLVHRFNLLLVEGEILEILLLILLNVLNHLLTSLLSKSHQVVQDGVVVVTEVDVMTLLDVSFDLYSSSGRGSHTSSIDWGQI